MNSFERFRINHLSASSLNLWMSSQSIWAARYIGNIKDDGNAAMWRGSAVENGLAALLRGQAIEFAVGAAHQAFDLNCNLATDVSSDERDLIQPMLDQCAAWKPPSELLATQLKIEHFFDPVPVPIIGYLDMSFDEADIDLKTTKALPSKPRAEHIRQVSIYRAARNKAGGLLYVTNKKHAYYEVNDEMMGDALNEMHACALSLQNFLARCEGPDDIFRSLPPIDYENFRAPKTKVKLTDLLLAG